MVGGAAVKQRAMAAMCMAFGQILGSFIGGPAAQWFGRRLSYSIFCVTSLISALLVFQISDGYGLRLLVLAAIAGVFTTSFFGWLPLYLPELFPTRIRSTGEGISFNIGRVVAAVAILLGFGQLDKVFGGSYTRAGSTMSFVYVIGLILIWFMPETKGAKLPD
jgi:MFS family permease